MMRTGKWSAEEWQIAKSMHGTYTAREIARVLNRHHHNVQQKLSYEGQLKSPTRGPDRVEWTAEMIAARKVLKESGCDAFLTAQKIGVAYATLCKADRRGVFA